jgi:hypothetical protein
VRAIIVRRKRIVAESDDWGWIVGKPETMRLLLKYPHYTNYDVVRQFVAVGTPASPASACACRCLGCGCSLRESFLSVNARRRFVLMLERWRAKAGLVLGLLFCSPLCPAGFLGCDNPLTRSRGHCASFAGD